MSLPLLVVLVLGVLVGAAVSLVVAVVLAVGVIGVPGTPLVLAAGAVALLTIAAGRLGNRRVAALAVLVGLTGLADGLAGNTC